MDRQRTPAIWSSSCASTPESIPLLTAPLTGQHCAIRTNRGNRRHKMIELYGMGSPNVVKI